MQGASWTQLWRGALQKPDFWLRSLCVCVVLACVVQLLQFAPGRDQGIYLAVADGMIHGEMPYRDRWDFKPPGIYFVYLLARALFGQALWGVRVLEVLGILILCGCLLRLSATYLADDRPGFLAGALATLLHTQMEFWHSGQPEFFGGVLTALALSSCTLRPASRPWRVLVWFACGLAFGGAFLLKPPLGGGALVCALYVARARANDGARLLSLAAPVVSIAAGAAFAVASVVAWFVVEGAWPALRWTLFEFTPGYTKLGWNEPALGAFYRASTDAFVRFSALTSVGALAAIALPPCSSREREGLALLLGVIAMQTAGIAMQAKFFAYHFDAVLMLVAMIAGLGWFKLWRLALGRGGAPLVAFASGLILCAAARAVVNDVPHGFWERSRLRLSRVAGLGDSSRAALDADLYRAADYSYGADLEVARRIRELTTEGDSIFVWGFEPLLYVLSERAPASRFLYNVPQRTSWEQGRARAELLADLAHRPPALVVVQHGDFFKFVTGNEDDSNRALSDFPVLAGLLEREYRHAGRIEDFDLYLRGAAPGGSPADPSPTRAPRLDNPTPLR